MKEIALSLFVLQVSLGFPSAALAGVEDWRAHMQALSKSLIDVFPFIYSKSEFRDPANRKRISTQLKKLSTTAHSLPEQSGQVLLGAEPLVRDARTSISAGFERAYGLFERKNYAAAQTESQQTVFKCFACHTATQIGARFSATNPEVMEMATPFAQGKVFVYGALRQFNGALEFIEKQPPTLEYVKLHLIVSLRGLQEFDRAEKYLEKVSPHFKKDKTGSELITQWTKDLRKWKATPDSGSSERPVGELAFVDELRETLVLHRKVLDKNLTAQSKAETYLRLGELYALLRVEALRGLSALYFEACRNEKPSEDLLKKCSVPVEALSNQT